MSLSQISKGLSFRLAFWYVAGFIIIIVILFVLSYSLISSSLTKEDRSEISAKAQAYIEAYRADEHLGLETIINSERAIGNPHIFFVRVATAENTTLFLSLPESFTDIQQIDRLKISEGFHALQINSLNGKTIFEIGSFSLYDGSFLQVGKEVTRREDLLVKFRQTFYIVVIPAMFIALIGGYLLTSRALKPLRQLNKTVRSIIATGNTKALVPVDNTSGELNELVVVFNRMLEMIDKLIEGMKESLDNISHDIRTPLTRMRSVGEAALQSERLSEECSEALSVCLEESDRIIRMLKTLMDISEAETGILKLHREEVNLNSLIDEVVGLYRYIADEKGISICASLCTDIYIYTDPVRLQQVIANLIDNAVKYTDSDGKISIDMCENAERVIISVSDTGCGIAEGELPKIWGRLYRSDKSRSERGMGLGLNIAQSFIKSLGGKIEVSSVMSVGSTFTIYLPKRHQSNLSKL